MNVTDVEECDNGGKYAITNVSRAESHFNEQQQSAEIHGMFIVTREEREHFFSCLFFMLFHYQVWEKGISVTKQSSSSLL